MTADIIEATKSPVAAANDDEVLVDNFGREIVSGFSSHTHMAYALPMAIKYLLLLFLENLRIRVIFGRKRTDQSCRTY